MLKHFSIFGAAIASLAPCLLNSQTPLTGHVDIKQVHSYAGTAPLAKPSTIVVYNFAATPEEVKLNKALLSRVRTKMSGAEGDDKTKLAHKIMEDFSQSLVKDLEKTGLTVMRGAAGEAAPDGSLAVQGDFSLIDEGNRTRRMAIGLGFGDSKVQTHVECYLKQPDRNLMVTEFQATSRSSWKPGAAATMGAGAAPAIAGAAAGATELKQDAEGDTGRMAKAVAKEITKTLTARGWIEESK